MAAAAGRIRQQWPDRENSMSSSRTDADDVREQVEVWHVGRASE
jgi:hypothetical protein